jgi:hypothetical protein
MRADRNRKVKASPLPHCGDFSTAMSDVDDRLRALRETARTGAGMLSAASSIASLQVDLIASSFGLLRLLEDLAFQLSQKEYPHQEKIRRLRRLIRFTNKVQGTILRAIDIYLSCFGGKEAIAIQAINDWITRQRERSPADAAQIDQIMKFIIAKSAK